MNSGHERGDGSSNWSGSSDGRDCGLAAVADRVGLTAALSRELAGLRGRRAGHDPGRVIRDLAVMLADGGDCLADMRAVRGGCCRSW